MERNGESSSDGHPSDHERSEVSAEGGQPVGSCEGEGSKRQRVQSGSGPPSPGFFVPGMIAASPPRFVSFEQIMKAANAVSKMTLAHEIAVNKDFKLEKVEPDDSLHKHVKAVVHQAFWKIFRSQLQEDPPSYDHAMILLAEIKEGLQTFLLPHHTKQKQEIGEVLDIELIRQQADNGALDFQYYAQYILSVMSKLCAPVRDDRIRELMRFDDVVDLFRGIFDTLDLMKLDMANFHIQMIRPHLQQHSIEYEKKRFAEYLDINDDGLQFTRRWLKKAVERLPKPATMSSVLTDAYMRLLNWDKDEPFPETLLMDQTRFAELCCRLDKTTFVAAVMLMTYSTVGPAIAGLAQFKEELKNHLNVLLDSKKPSETIDHVVIQVLTDVNRCLSDHGHAQLSEEAQGVLKGQIEETAQPDHRVRSLVRTRVLEFIAQCLGSSSAYPIKIPPGLSIMQLELSEITGQFLRLVSHNRAVFGTVYTDILAAEMPDQSFNITANKSESSSAAAQSTD